MNKNVIATANGEAIRRNGRRTPGDKGELAFHGGGDCGGVDGNEK